MCQFGNTREAKKRRCPFDRMEGPKDRVEGLGLLGVSVEAQQGGFDMLAMITALLHEIAYQLPVDVGRERTQPVWGRLNIIHRRNIP